MKTELSLWPKKMANCFDIRTRTSSFDLHQVSQKHKFSRLFRSSSDTSVKSSSPKGSPKTSPKTSPKSSPTTATNNRRRFMRVVKNDQAAGEEYENPHLIRRYTKEYVQEQWSQRSSGSFDDQHLPYTVTGHTILKKPSQDSPTNSGDQSPSTSKHASFKEEVQIIEFDKKGRVETCHCFTHLERLQDSDDEGDSSMELCEFCAKKGRQDCPHVSSDSEQSDCDTAKLSDLKAPVKEPSPDSIVDKFLDMNIEGADTEIVPR